MLRRKNYYLRYFETQSTAVSS